MYYNYDLYLLFPLTLCIKSYSTQLAESLTKRCAIIPTEIWYRGKGSSKVIKHIFFYLCMRFPGISQLISNTYLSAWIIYIHVNITCNTFPYISH